MNKKYYSEASMAIHESAKDLFDVGAISETEMKDFDNRCLVQEPAVPYNSSNSIKTEQIKPITA